MVVPGPDDAQLNAILELASRTPDHGKLFPWRFVVIEDRKALADLMTRAFIAANPDARSAQIEAVISPAYMAPSLVILLHAPKVGAKIPEWEQQLSTGAVGMNLLHAAHVHGYVASWITGWATYDPIVTAEFCAVDECIAGYFYIGSPRNLLEERPRPDMSDITRHWPDKAQQT